MTCRMRIGQGEVTWYDEDGEVTMHVDSNNKVTTYKNKQEPVAMQMDVIVVNLVREGINKHRARELAEHFIKHTHPQPKREPLTDEQIAEFFGVKAVDESFVDFVRAIEAAHGIISDMKQEHVDKTAKQRHEWVGLTEQKETGILLSSNTVYSAMKFTEAKLMEKNK